MSGLFDDVPFQRHSPTSRKAAKKIEEVAPTLEKQVYECLAFNQERQQGCGDDHYGMTDREIQKALKLNGSTERPRRRAMELRGIVSNSGRTRLETERGRHRRCVIWIVCKEYDR